MLAIAPQYTRREFRWTEWKTVKSKKMFAYQYDEDDKVYQIYGYDGPEVNACIIYKTEVPYAVIASDYTQEQNDLDKADFEANYKSSANLSIKSEVITQEEKNDKSLRMVCGFAKCNVDGLIRIAIKIPANGRKIAYGDGEFKVRKFGDIISKLEVSDLEKGIAWMMALAMNPEATDPLPDEVIRTLTKEQMGGNGPFPLYPVLDHYDERDLPTGVDAPFNEGTIVGGCSMTFQFGLTEIKPVGGYGNIPGSVYLVIEAKNVLTPRVLDEECQFSIDWGEPQ